MFNINEIPTELYKPSNAPLLSGIMRGIEKESLRVRPNATLAPTPHPVNLGSALTHPCITTDFSEALLEFITPPSHRSEDALSHLENIHAFVATQLGDELLWGASMPCALGEDKDIPIAHYGSSNSGMMKSIYRIGLGNRYGRAMQTVAGIHYNFSMPNAFWAFLHNQENSLLSLEDFRTQRYFDLIRNFRRHYWLLLYLFGASPAVCKSFVSGREHHLQVLEHSPNTLYAPYATALRMGDLGYQSSAQETLYVCYNELKTYLQTLCQAITISHPPYANIGLRDEQGQYQQLNTGLLQIENEFYSAIRPKHTARSGETALTALHKRGVEYIEIRCLDIDPYSPIGITLEQTRFLDTFLVYCLLQESPLCDPEESLRVLENQKAVVNSGRDPNLSLSLANGESLKLQDWGQQLLQAMEPIGELLDKAQQTESHCYSLAMQREKFSDSKLTPSARILLDMEAQQLSHTAFVLQQSNQHKNSLINYFSNPCTERFQIMAEESLAEQAQVEKSDDLDFDQYLKNYYQQYGCPDLGSV